MAVPPACSAEEGYLHINGVDHFYRSVGEGEPYVVLHGGPGMYHDELYPFFLDFAKSHRVIFYDQRGNGRSQMSSVDSTNFNVELLVDDLDQLRRAFDIEKLNIIGHSWGGLLAMYYAVEHPNNVERLIAISPAPVNTDLLIQCYQNQVSMYSEAEWLDLQEIWESKEYMAGNPKVHNRAMRMAETVLFYDKSKFDTFMASAAFDSITAKAAVALNDLERSTIS
ncbi:MAG: alpha/beta fold hydrolase [bacterium]|nr:alpha/beta fold hydrolase [bacterium]